MIDKKSAEEFVNSLMDEIPEGHAVSVALPVTVSPGGKGKSKKNSGAGDDDPSAGGDGDPPIICDPLAPGDLVLKQMLTEGEAARIVYDRLLLEMADEAAQLKKLREAFQTRGLVFSKISRDLVAILKDLSEIMEKKAKEQALSGMNSGKIDFKSEGFQRIMSWFLAEVKGSCADVGLPATTVTMFFAKLQQRTLGFEEQAEELYQGDSSKRKKKSAQVQV